MAIGYLTLSSNQAGAISTWTCIMYPDGPAYTTPTWGGQAITVTVPAEMQGATFNSATLTYTVSSPSGTRYVRYNGESVSVGNSNLLERLIAGGNLDLYFSYKATGGTGGEGAHSASCTWNNITITVDYTPATGLTGSATITNAGSAIYSLEKASLAYGESITFGLTVRPTVAITKVTTLIYPGSLTTGITLSTDKNVAANGGASLAYTLAITDAVYAAMTQRTHNAQIQITLTGANGTNYTTGRIQCEDATSLQRFKLLKTRNAPVISGVSWGESGTSHISTYGNLISGKTVPTISFSVTLDTDADSGIGYEGRTLTVGNKTYTLSANSGTLNSIVESGSVVYTITVTDSYGQTGTLSGTITVLAYTAPSLRNVAINRYITTVNSGGSTVYELDDDGTSLRFDAEITVQTSLGSGTNKWSLKITPAGGTVINAVTNSSTASVTYTHNRTFITGSYANTSSFDFTVELSDAFTTITYQVNVPKAGGIFNIETTGVAVGMRSTGTDANPLFQSAYPAYFLAGAYGADGNRIDVSDDTGWQAVTLVNSAAYDSTTTPMARRRNKVIYIKGAIKLNATLSSYAQGATNRTQIGTLPTGIRPADNYQFSIVADARYIKLIIETDGKMYLMNHCGNAVGASLKISLACSFMED